VCQGAAGGGRRSPESESASAYKILRSVTTLKIMQCDLEILKCRICVRFRVRCDITAMRYYSISELAPCWKKKKKKGRVRTSVKVRVRVSL